MKIWTSGTVALPLAGRLSVDEFATIEISLSRWRRQARSVTMATLRRLWTIGVLLSAALWGPRDGVATGAPAVTETPAAPANFDAFLAELWPDARSRGISRATFDRAFAGLTPDPRVIAATKRQPEYGKPVGAYVNSVVSNARVAAGEQRASRHAGIFQAVEQKFAVDRWVILG